MGAHALNVSRAKPKNPHGRELFMVSAIVPQAPPKCDRAVSLSGREEREVHLTPRRQV